MNGALDELFYSTIPDPLWHYTTISGFEGIVSSGAVWATEAHHTTDASEFIHAREVGAAFLKKMDPSDRPTQEAKRAATEILRSAYDEVLSPDQLEVFVASFSSAKDLKSQWMGYADGGKGVSIALDLRAIRPPKESESGVTLAACVYEDRQKEDLLEAALTHIMETTGSIYRRFEDPVWVRALAWREKIADKIRGARTTSSERIAFAQQQYHRMLYPAANRSIYELLRVASHCKHRIFFEEHEWRLALPHSKNRRFTINQIEYRSDPPIPYVAHKIGGGDKLPITSVILGPFCNERDRVVQALSNFGYDVPVTDSEWPARRAPLNSKL